MAFDDAGLKPGESLRLIAYSGESKPRVLAATVGEKLISCDLTDQAVYSDFYYSIRLGVASSIVHRVRKLLRHFGYLGVIMQPWKREPSRKRSNPTASC